jgi:hypothetical protein
MCALDDTNFILFARISINTSFSDRVPSISIIETHHVWYKNGLNNQKKKEEAED